MNAKARCVEKFRDERLLVLLVFGLSISLSHRVDCLSSIDRTLSVNTGVVASHYYLWKEASGEPAVLFHFSSPDVLAVDGLPAGIIVRDPVRDTRRSSVNLVGKCLLSDEPLEPQLAPLFFQPVAINRAPAEVLVTLPGIGEKLAARIVAHREKHGPFRQPSDLLRVNGVGAGKFNGIAGLLVID